MKPSAAPSFQINKCSFPSREEEILDFWNKNKVFEASIDSRRKGTPFTFYDGPPFATGLPHYGHLLAGTIKDVVPRYKTMKGFYVPRRFGWDCHGLPVENEIEKNFDLSGKKEIEAFGMERFNDQCRSIVLRYTSEWEATVNRMGRWVDFKKTYKTMDLSFMESVWWVFKQLHEKGLIYQGFKVMPFSAKLGTPLSNFEAGENYKDVEDPSLIVAFPLEGEDVSILVWTTTPWTLPSNLALMVSPDIVYAEVSLEETGKKYLLAHDRLEPCLKDRSYKVLRKISGRDLIGKRYKPIFSYFLDRKEEGAFRVIGESEVSAQEGTGIVHSAPAFGEIDFYACKREGIALVCPVDENGRFTREVPEYEGRFVKDCDREIIRQLKVLGFLFEQATLRHRYPFCWRSDTPLIYKAVSTWFVAVETLKEKIVQANQEVKWTPDHIKDGRFGKWLEGARDWAISRNRYWGTPLPIWRSPSGKIRVVGSVDELEKLTGKRLEDLHRQFVDPLTFKIDGEEYKRVDEVFDCWFESGSMPYGQIHYPFENGEQFFFPADFIAEGLDQTRGWFYTLIVLSTALFGESPFKNVIVNGIVLAEDGAKMSKRLRNYPAPLEVVNKYGADAIRLYMLSSPAVKADDLCFSEMGVELVLRQVLIPFWNSYLFFATYAKIYDWKPRTFHQPTSLMDRWILSSLHKLIHEVEIGMDQYDLQKAVEPLVAFIESLTNWFIRRSRRRFWSDEASKDREEAFQTLYQVLVGLCQVAAPFIPFLTDAIWRELRSEEMALSVHLSDFPAYNESVRDLELEKAMEAVQEVVSLGHALRKTHKLKVRQPLGKAFITSPDQDVVNLLKSKVHLIQDELNVKEVDFSLHEEELVQLKAKPVFRRLGKRVGKKMPLLQKKIEEKTREELEAVLGGDHLVLDLDGESFIVFPDEIEIIREVKEGVIAQNLGRITVALSPELTEELVLEGLARELINKINSMRRDLDFEVTDRIILKLDTTEKVKNALQVHLNYILEEVLATEVFFEENGGEIWDLNGEAARIEIERG